MDEVRRVELACKQTGALDGLLVRRMLLPGTAGGGGAGPKVARLIPPKFVGRKSASAFRRHAAPHIGV